MIISTHATKKSVKLKILKLVSVEVVGIIIIIVNIIIIIIIIICQLQNNKETMDFTDCLWGHFRFKATEICTAVWGPNVKGAPNRALCILRQDKGKVALVDVTKLCRGE